MSETFLIKTLFIRKESLAQVFSCEFCEISKKTFFIEHLRTTASLTALLAVLRSFVARRCEKAPWFTKFYDLL